MFAVKQASRCLSRRLQSMVATKLIPNNAVQSAKLPLTQPAQFATPHACFTCQSNSVSSLEKGQRQSNTLLLESTVSSHTEPDVLYHMIEVEIRGSDKVVLKSYDSFITLTAKHLGLTLGDVEISQKPHIKRWTVLKSRHVHNKHWVSYEVRTYHHKIQFYRLTGSTADTFLEYIQRNLPEGVSMRVGRVRMEKLPEHLCTPPSTDGMDN